ncbi:MAG: HAD family phosphatase [Phycisphaerales bacterium]|nr:MAG: HAD family phosphatase [Phycisphaerales bacterium]
MSGTVIIHGVIFDLDGVLILTADAHFKSWEQLVAENGLAVTREQFLSTFGRPNRDIIPRLWGGPLDAATIDALGERKEELYRRIVRGALPVAGGANELIRACHAAGLKLAIGSSTHPQNLALTMAQTGWGPYFAATVTGRDVSRGKPDPEVFQLAAARLGLSPQECVVIEDAPAGIQAARAAGCAAVGVMTHHGAEALWAAGAGLVVGTLEELTVLTLRQLRPGQEWRTATGGGSPAWG